MFREALCTAILAENGLEIIGQASDGGTAVKAARSLQPDLIIMDINLPIKNGVDATREIIANDPNARILVLTSSADSETVLAAVQAGAMGYILKEATRPQFMAGLMAVAQGNQFLPAEITRKLTISLLQQHFTENTDKPAYELLSKREKEVLGCLGKGLSNKDIAETLVLSESTVRVHIFNILDKLHLKNRNQAIVFALQQAANQ